MSDRGQRDDEGRGLNCERFVEHHTASVAARKAMLVMPTRLIKRLAEFRPEEEVDLVPRGTRGIYVLFRQRRRANLYDVVYVGLSNAGIRTRLRSHRRSRTKSALWSHFSVFEVRDNVSEAVIAELEGLFRLIYRRDSRANPLNIQRTHQPLKRVRLNDLAVWSAS